MAVKKRLKMVPGVGFVDQINYNAMLQVGSAFAAAPVIHQIATQLFDRTKPLQSLATGVLESFLITVLFSKKTTPELKIFIFVFANAIIYGINQIPPLVRKETVPSFLKEMLPGKNPFAMVGQKEQAKLLTNIMRTDTPQIAILGLPGVGKTRLVEHMVELIKEAGSDAASPWRKKRIFFLSHHAFIGGTIYYGSWQARVQQLLLFAEKNPDALIFIDEMHVLMDHGRSMKSESSVADYLKPAITDNKIRIIGGTTLDDFDKFVGRDSAFESRFNTLEIQEPDKATCIEILKGRLQSEKYSAFHFSDEALEAVVTYSNQLAVGKMGNPRKVIQLMENVMTHNWDEKEISLERVKAVFEQKLQAEQARELRRQKQEGSSAMNPGQLQQAFSTFLQRMFSQMPQGQAQQI